VVIREAMNIQERVLGAENCDTLDSYVLLADIYIMEGTPDEAEKILKSVLQLTESQFGQEHSTFNQRAQPTS
jgi:Tfp pilus assembly protein FimV